MSLVILTKSPEFDLREFAIKCKLLIKFLLGQKRGPEAVVLSLVRGLNALKIDYKYNVKAKRIFSDDIVYINGNIGAVEWAIEAKKKGEISKLIVGPSLCVVPDKSCRIIFDKNIDVIIEPSNWVKDLWVSLAPELADKIAVWAAGVDIPSEYKAEGKKYCLVYQKDADEALLSQVLECVKSAGMTPRVIRYGHYRYDDYLNILRESKMMVYLSQSESQGIALQEAWAMDVPTLVWNRGYWQYNGYMWRDEKISAPYLSPESGMFFKDGEDVRLKLPEFVSKLSSFTSNKYVLENLTDQKAAEKFMDIVNKL
jgi:hypothetical protein